MQHFDDIAKNLICWTLSEPHPGMQNQAVGLAEALGVPYEIKHVRSQNFWKFLPPTLWPQPLSLNITGLPFTAPWPDILISSGRHSVATALAIKKASGGKTFTIHIQNPQTDLRNFDLVIVPEHDRLQGNNVIKTLGALNRVTPQKIEQTTITYQALQDLPRPRIAVLVGGPTKRQKVGPIQIKNLTDKLAQAAQASGGASLMVTPSRRTGSQNEAVLRAGLKDIPAFIWDGQGSNPYFEMLKLADFIVVTGESVSMVSEACATGKPIYVHHLYPDKKLARFHAELQQRGITRIFNGQLETWLYPPLTETSAVAELVKSQIACKI